MAYGSDKKGLVFAKDPKQGVLAIFAIFLFAGSMIYLYNTMHPSDSNSTPPPVAQDTTATQNPTDVAINSSPSQQNMAQEANNIFTQTMNMQGNQNQVSVSPTASTVDGVEIITKPRAPGKMVSISVVDSGRMNPFLPDSESFGLKNSQKAVSLPFLTPPPETLPFDPDAGKIMNTTISGILYDKYSPSAIINIEGIDYLVKRGDIIKRYKVISISQNAVVVKLGNNIYTAGVGEILSPSDLQNITANLNKKFGGNDVTINIKKKG